MTTTREVWKYNIDLELSLVELVMRSCDFVAIDTEYPGFLRTTPRGSSPLQTYSDLKFNVDRLRPIQFGFTFFDRTGNTAGVWQFNFCDFDPKLGFNDVDSSTSLSLSNRKSGIDFEKQRRDGIISFVFAQKFNRILKIHRHKLNWITFHGIYDFAYMTKVMTESPLPSSSRGFQSMIGDIFRSIYDMKFIAKFCPGLLSGELGLKKLSTLLNVPQTGKCHQAGPDSYTTARVFMKMKELYNIEEKVFGGFIYGIEGRVDRRKEPPILQQVYHPMIVRCAPNFAIPRPVLYGPPSYIVYM